MAEVARFALTDGCLCQRDAARILGISHQRVGQLVAEGKLRSHRRGALRLIDAGDITARAQVKTIHGVSVATAPYSSFVTTPTDVWAIEAPNDIGDIGALLRSLVGGVTASAAQPAPR